MIKYQFPNTRFDQISDLKHGIHLYGKLFTMLLVQIANKNTNFLFMGKRQLFSVLSMVSEATVQKNSKQTLP